MSRLQQMSNEAKAERPVFEFTIPESISGDVKTVGLIELTAQEEMQAAKRSGGDQMKLAYELVKQCIVEVNGEKVKLSDGTVDTAFNKMPSKARAMVLAAYADIHAPPEDAAQDFLASRKVRVG